MTTVRTIVEEWLRAHGYDGLCERGAVCGCQVADLMPCDSPCDACRPAHRRDCTGCDVDDHPHWHMEPDPPTEADLDRTIDFVRHALEDCGGSGMVVPVRTG